MTEIKDDWESSFSKSVAPPVRFKSRFDADDDEPDEYVSKGISLYCETGVENR